MSWTPISSSGLTYILASLGMTSPNGRTTRLAFERFASLENVHLAGVRMSITPEDDQGTVEIRSGIKGNRRNGGWAR